MKKKLIVLTAFCVMLMGANFNANAQHLIVKAGLSYSNLDLNSKIGDLASSFKIGNYTGYHFGLGFQTGKTLGFSLQPELLYNVKGSKLNDNISWTMNYLEVPVNIQWGPDLVVCRPYIMASPYVGYSVRSKLKVSSGTKVSSSIESMAEDANRFAYGIGLGAGIEILKFQISAKYSWNFGSVGSPEEYIDSVKNISKKNASSLEVSLGLLF